MIKLNIVITLLADSQTTEEFLGNFAEADFDLEHVSVIMKSVADRNKIADNFGPLKNVDIASLSKALQKYAVSSDKIKSYLDGLNTGLVFVAVDFYRDDSIVSMLNDYHPQLLLTLSP